MGGKHTKSVPAPDSKQFSSISGQTRESTTVNSPPEEDMEPANPVTVIIVGAGGRGHNYSSFANIKPGRFKVVGVCDPREYHRNYEVKNHKIPPENAFSDWKEAAEREKFADCAIICTPDKLHKDPTIAFAKKGYHILLEKPMATTEEDCREIVETCKSNNIILSVCHVLRYTPWVDTVKRIIDSGAIGRVVNINHTEPVGYWHFAHSFVRGNWHKEADSSFSLLAKCCHDVDLICYWMNGKPCQRVSSFGNLSHFCKEDKPEGAASRCLDCPSSIEQNCPYSAKRLYLDPVKLRGGRGGGWPISVITDTVDIENVTDALRNGPYGKCVYDTDNDVMSHQVVNMQFEGGATATLQMVAFTKRLCAREVKIYGTMGELTVQDDFPAKIEVYDFRTQKRERYNAEEDESVPFELSGHGEADYHTIKAFVETVQNPTADKVQTGPDQTLASHLLTFAAERARKENRVLNLNSSGLYE